MTGWIAPAALGAVYALGACLAWDLARANLRHGHHAAPRLAPLIVGEGDPRFGSMTLTGEQVVHHELPVTPRPDFIDRAVAGIHGRYWPDEERRERHDELLADVEAWLYAPAPPPSEAEVAASRALHGYIPELDPGPEAAAPAPSPDQLTIREDWTMPTDIACRACAQVDDGWACQADLGGRCPSDPGNYVPEPDPRGEPDLGPRAWAVLEAYEGRLGARKTALT